MKLRNKPYCIIVFTNVMKSDWIEGFWTLPFMKGVVSVSVLVYSYRVFLSDKT